MSLQKYSNTVITKPNQLQDLASYAAKAEVGNLSEPNLVIKIHLHLISDKWT